MSTSAAPYPASRCSGGPDWDRWQATARRPGPHHRITGNSARPAARHNNFRQCAPPAAGTGCYSSLWSRSLSRSHALPRSRRARLPGRARRPGAVGDTGIPDNRYPGARWARDRTGRVLGRDGPGDPGTGTAGSGPGGRGPGAVPVERDHRRRRRGQLVRPHRPHRILRFRAGYGRQPDRRSRQLVHRLASRRPRAGPSALDHIPDHRTAAVDRRRLPR